MHGIELVDGTARLAAMNLLLHGIGEAHGDSLIEVKDALIADPGRRWSIVLSSPPFGRKSPLTMVGADGREVREDLEIERQDFVVTTSNKQFNFLQHIMTILDINGRALPSSSPTTSSSREEQAPCGLQPAATSPSR